MNKFKKNKEFLIGLCIVSVFIGWFFFWILYANFIQGAPGSPYVPSIDLQKELLSPGKDGFLFGTDLYGRSILELLSAGLQYSLTLSIIVTFLTCSIGIIVGYIMVRAPKWVSVFFDMLTNLIFIFPTILIAIVFLSVVGNSLMGLCTVLVVTGWASYARIARGEIKRVMALSYIESAKAIGIGEFRLFIKLVIPAISSQMIIHMVLGISGVIISEAVLGFLGLGGSQYSWGVLLSMAKNVLLEAPSLVIILSATMAFLIIGLNLLGDGLRDILDPKES